MRIFQGTNVGTIRKTNEDSLFASQNVFLVADGMGGHVGGEIASSLLVETVKNFLQDKDYIDEITLKDSIVYANQIIWNKSRENPDYFGMGTTATLAYVKDDVAYYAHVGDSRLYLFRNNNLSQITEDHSYVASLVKNGVITEERNYILRAVGVDENLDVDTGKFNLLKGDKLFLTTDGLVNCISDEMFKQILSSEDIDPVNIMIKYALSSIAKDNITAIVMVYD